MSLRNEVMEQHERIRAAEAEKLDAENEIHLLKDAIAAKRAEGFVPIPRMSDASLRRDVALLHKS
jgi:hypothetical protein